MWDLLIIPTNYAVIFQNTKTLKKQETNWNTYVHKTNKKTLIPDKNQSTAFYKVISKSTA